ncbi:hypothetical protein NADFUDRAFT_82752 [Nadsonia fulvescens var. elongata DSM 6958]|uniref:Mob1/phocein n=1 Tax=Nadsonia fulvescens var. elongata DSM 6958 TaxID=857566 RepID=A0A1E3PK39_9ASCO|nr:hypothetical protein NADFUDRAFT_82752 [Nadsonia fulvescens var. elongata DSM 6958]
MSFFQSLNLNNNSRTTRTPTFKTQNAGGNPRGHLLKQYAEATLGSGSLVHAVVLPQGEDVNEWLAVHVVDFFNQINMLYASITKFCSPETCPRMTATDEYEYLWQDSNSELYKRPTKMSAPAYIEHLMMWVQGYLDNETVFPNKLGAPFPRNFPMIVAQIMKRLFRVYAHLYCHHFDIISELGLPSHLNTSLKHFVLFVKEFNLVDDKELAPLRELIEMLIQA